jgi:hypothetical protein
MKLDYSGFYPSEDYLCVATLLELILNNFGYNIDRYEIANYFGVNIPVDEKISKVQHYYNTEDKNKLGIIINDNNINSIFNHFHIKLIEKYTSINTILEESFVSTVKKMMEESYVICGFDYGYVYDEPKNIRLGHVSIITEITDDNVMLFDPGPRNFGMKKIDTYRLFCGIKKKQDGLWCICEPTY